MKTILFVCFGLDYNKNDFYLIIEFQSLIFLFFKPRQPKNFRNSSLLGNFLN